jgi:16S rRNA (guanine527-N7)-methyltransferase
VEFRDELELAVPHDIPQRDRLVSGAARHLELIVATNHHFNLTRITEAREAVIKHVVDSVLPWRLFSSAGRVMDAGTGAGFPGIPLAFVYPDTHFLLVESTQKKARFVESAAAELGLDNVEVLPHRAEEILAERRVDLITARAVAPLERLLPLFAPAVQKGARGLFYKGPDIEAEIAATERDATKRHVRFKLLEKYELPSGMGSRSIVEMIR